MKNQCQHTGQNAAFKLLFSRIPIREILNFGRRIWISPEKVKRRIESQKFRKRIFSPEEVPICPEEKVLKKVFLKQEKDEIVEWDGNLEEIFSSLEKISAKTQ